MNTRLLEIRQGALIDKPISLRKGMRWVWGDRGQRTLSCHKQVVFGLHGLCRRPRAGLTGCGAQAHLASLQGVPYVKRG